MAYKGENITEIGDYRDIPMTLGLIVMVWNSCEQDLKHLLVTLGSKNIALSRRALEPLVMEMGSVAISQALSC